MKPIEPLTQDGTLFPKGIPVFEDPELVTRKDQGQALAKTLGEGKAVLLRNHGIVTVGETIEEAWRIFAASRSRITRSTENRASIRTTYANS
jgi:ribulose-5-phosphate 4-epimerase/fuculose-1-phosphate aldolase